VRKGFDASPRSGPRLNCQTLTSIWVAIRMACRAVNRQRKVFPKHLLDAFCRIGDWHHVNRVDNQGAWNTLLSSTHTIIQSSKSSWSSRPGEIISRLPPYSGYDWPWWWLVSLIIMAVAGWNRVRTPHLVPVSEIQRPPIKPGGGAVYLAGGVLFLLKAVVKSLDNGLRRISDIIILQVVFGTLGIWLCDSILG